MSSLASERPANVGNVDRTLRVIVGVGLLSLIVILQGPGRLWGLIGLLPLFSGIFGNSRFYTRFGINTNHAAESDPG